MKRSIATLSVMLLLAASASAAPQTMIRSDVSHGGMGAFSTGGMQINGKWAAVSGGRGQWIINHQFGLGLGSYNIYPSPDVRWQGNDYDLRIEFGGVDLEYFIRPDDMLHYTLSAMIGGGKVEATAVGMASPSDDFFSFLPQAGAEVNVTRWFRISGTAGYHIVSGVNLVGLQDDDLGGFIANLTFKFGKF